jgi:hypothetical protein
MSVHAARHGARSIYDGQWSSLPLARCQGWRQPPDSAAAV